MFFETDVSSFLSLLLKRYALHSIIYSAVVIKPVELYFCRLN